MSQEKIERWNEVTGNDAPQDKLTAFLDSSNDSYAHPAAAPHRRYCYGAI